MQEVVRHTPVQKPGRSIQNYATPPEFIVAVKRFFSVAMFAYDLAAEPETTKGERFFSKEDDSLKQDWIRLSGDLWLNPPFGQIAPWAAKCAEYGRLGPGRIFFLVPASIGANWFAEHVWPGCQVTYALQGRLSFDGKGPFPKDCMLSVFGNHPNDGFDVWDWRR